MKETKLKVAAAGHICLDITPKFQNKSVNHIDQLLKPGSLLNVGSADIHIGGSVSNTGLGLKIFGADVSLMGKIGTDDFGKIVKAQLEENGASTEYMIESPDSDTSYSIVLAPQGIDRMFLHNPGANADFSSSDLDYERIGQMDLFHFGYPPLMKKMYENDGEDLVRMYKKISEMGVATSLDTAAVDENSEAGKVDWENVLQNVLPYVDFFVPSVEELAFMIDRPLYHSWQKKAAGRDITEVVQESEVSALADRLIAWGAKIVLIKCGVPGMFLATGHMDALAQLSDKTCVDLFGWEDVRHFETSYRPSRVLSGTGAGDTSIAAFLYAVFNEYSWKETLQLTTATGASCVEEYDAISGLKSFEELQERIAAGWEKNEICSESA